MTDKLFVYGTLLTGVKNEFADFLAQHSEPVGPGTMQGQLFRISWYPGAITSKSQDEVVHGQVLQIRNNIETVFKHLDMYEGIGDGFARPYEFVRKEVSVRCYNQELKCWAYLYDLNTDGLESIPTGDFLSSI